MATQTRTAERPAPLASGTPGAPRRRRRGWILPLYTWLVIVYLFIPIGVMALFSFNDYTGRFNFAWEGFTLRHWETIFDVPELVDAIKNTLVVALVAVVISTILGTLVALALSRFHFRGRSALNLLIFTPMATPEIVIGASLLSFFLLMRLPFGFVTIIIAHVMFCISFVIVTVKARTSGFDRNLEYAAQDLGATPWVTFWTVTFPLIFPGILAASLLAAVLSIDDYVITTFNAGPVVTLPLWIYGVSRLGIPPQVNVIGTLLLLGGVAYVLISLVRSHGEEGEQAPPALLTKG